MLHEVASPEAGEELSPSASWQPGAFLLCLSPAGEQRCGEEVAHVCESAATKKQKEEVNSKDASVLSPKHSVREHAADLLCSSPEEDACIPQGRGSAL